MLEKVKVKTKCSMINLSLDFHYHITRLIRNTFHYTENHSPLNFDTFVLSAYHRFDSRDADVSRISVLIVTCRTAFWEFKQAINTLNPKQMSTLTIPTPCGINSRLLRLRNDVLARNFYSSLPQATVLVLRV